jgi:hypothetical protein
VKLAGEPNNPVRFKDDATADELRAEVLRQLGMPIDGGIIDFAPLEASDSELAGRCLFEASRHRVSVK